MATKPRLKICPNGHEFYKSSDCPVCPICEKNKINNDDHFAKIGAPAKRAFDAVGITQLKHLTKYSERELLALHGVGPWAIRILRPLMEENGLDFCQ